MNEVKNEVNLPLWKRFWIYQKERFPLIAHGPLILAFSFCAVSISSHLRAEVWPQWPSVAVAFISCLLFFLQLRIADEFKDNKEDCRYRPYRAVPRGLVRLRELAFVFVFACLIQLGLVLWWRPQLVLLLLITWSYLAMMSFEFGLRDWLKARPITYLWTHMLIMPLIDLYASSTDWLVVGDTAPPQGLIYFLAASFFNGIVIEIGRKIRTPPQEEEGVETYSRLWGCREAALVWFVMIVMTALFASLTAWKVGAFTAVGSVLIASGCGCGLFVFVFRQRQTDGRAKGFELAAALWTLCLYLSLGLLPGVLAHG
ncbi:UbiA family prenyltransferase [Desulfobulbus rhabdoformis]|jgi:4-hydroxybenzoate polyprenyltransferase|uniref:UbiA family prenyltransferase n=1 Tax=Desulfobulbus rhabdoformis TaxID=34032 RepID=UPI0019641833|nr:UbiA family prenyltransferase [Desulfobulbus rhabdoformis]MBM9612804.1 UbiA family prenyltransferase [Desulfobulbus rhabdoformis]